MTYPAPSPDYVGPAAHVSAGSNLPIKRIVLHSTVSDCVEGGARVIARYFQSEASGGSAHYVVDPGEVVQVVGDSKVAQHAPPNPGSLGVEMCDRPATGLAGMRRWRDQPHRLMRRRVARLVAELCLAYDVPPYYVGVRGLRAGKHGVTTHERVSKAFGQSTHWDPGAWPRRAFMLQVRRQVAAIKKEHRS